MIKRTTVAGGFYPQDKQELHTQITNYFNNAKPSQQTKRLFALIAPHAGYMYSGQTAANIYKITQQYQYTTAIIIAPSHHNNHIDFFIGDYNEYETPLGNLQVNTELTQRLLAYPEFRSDRGIDTREHSLEVQLPFLCYINPNIKIVPIIFAKQTKENAQKLAEYLSTIYSEDTLIIVSTDLSHFHSASTAEHKDSLLIENIKDFEIEGLYRNLANRSCEACGYGGILTLLYIARTMQGVEIDDVSYTHSGKVTNDNSQVVGYLSCGFYG